MPRSLPCRGGEGNCHAAYQASELLLLLLLHYHYRYRYRYHYRYHYRYRYGYRYGYCYCYCYCYCYSYSYCYCYYYYYRCYCSCLLVLLSLQQVRRKLVGADVKWTVLGQSFGGFCLLTYLSKHPEALKAGLFTGGLPPVGRPPADVSGNPINARITRRPPCFL